MYRHHKFFALLAACALVASSTLRAQDNTSQQTRPRRTENGARPAPPVAHTQAGVTRLSVEPTMRIGLATDLRSANISTSGRLVSVTNEGLSPTPLAASRVRLEPRSLTPLPPPTIAGTSFRVEISGAATRVDAERASSEIRRALGEESEVAFDVATNTWRVRVGKQGPREDVEELRGRLEEAGFPHASIVDARNATSSSSSASGQTSARTGAPSSTVASPSTGGAVRPVSRASVPLREVVAYAAPSRAVLMSSRAPVQFASDDERNAPVRFNEKPYRGRLEVFTNPSGTLTVVNVIGLEDYVRGVVPNELSPGGYGAIEALKAQAVAARTYAVKNRNQFASEGFDLLPTTRSQVYGGLSTEHPLSTRAVDETRGMVATYKGEPINALYTSTCGGRTEHVENIFNEPTPYLRGRECAIEGRAHFAPFTIKSSREPADIHEEKNAALARDVAVLVVNEFPLTTTRVTDAWLASALTQAELRNWLMAASRLSRQSAPAVSDDATQPPGFSSALMGAVYGPGYADTLLDDADVEYLLPSRDAGEIPARNRADVAMLLRDGHLALYPDATVRAREPMTRGRAIHTIARLLDARGILQLQKGTAKPTIGDALILRSATRGRDQPVSVSSDAYLFRAYGDGVYQMRTVAVVGGEPVTFHLNRGGQVDYLEVRPAPNGAAADRFSPFTNWTVTLTVSEAGSRLARWSRGIGSLVDLRIAARGWSRRVTDLELIGTSGTNHLRGGRIRSALGLREQLFVIERRYNETGRVVGFNIAGRGWGHGVGMCQVGAYGMARAGLSFDKILKAYYTDIEVTKAY